MVNDMDDVLRIKIDNEDKSSHSWFRAAVDLHNNIPSEETKKFLQLFNRMNHELKRTRDLNFQPEVGKFAAIYIDERSEWYRAYVTYKTRHGHTYLCSFFLIDIGSSIDLVNLSNNVQPLPPWFSTEIVDSQSFKLALYGIIPLTKEIQLKRAITTAKKDAEDWTPYHMYFLRKMINLASAVYFQQKYSNEEIKIGIITIQLNDKEITLQDELIREGLARLCDDNDHTNINFEYDHLMFTVKNIRNARVFDNSPIVRKKLYPTLPIKLLTEDEENILIGSKLQTDISMFDVRNDLSEIYPLTNTTCSTDSSYYSTSACTSMQSGKYYNEIQNRYSISKPRNNSENERTSTCNTICSTQRNECKSYNENDVSGLEPLVTEDESGEILIVTVGNNLLPIASLCNSPLDEKTIQMLNKLELRDINRCQKFLIPAILSRKNIIVIDAPGVGKTFASMISLISMLRETKDKEVLGVSPRSLIINPYASHCEKIHDDCYRLITGCKNVGEDSAEQDLRVNVAYGCGLKLEIKKLIELAEGYDILVCTPRCLLRLLVKDSFDLNKLEHVIFDEYHILHENYGTELNKIIEYVEKMKKKNLQKIIISNRWIKGLKKFLAPQTILLMSCYFEASFFIGFHHYFRFSKSETKIRNDVIEYLSKETEGENVVIVFNVDDELDPVYKDLRNCFNSRPIYKIHELTYKTLQLRDAYIEEANIGLGPILLCTDYTLQHLHIYEADCLVHYSLPKSRNSFNYRFSVLLRLLQKAANELINGKNIRKKPQVVFYMNESNRTQFISLIDILERSGSKIPEEILSTVIEVQRHKEYSKDTELCISVKQFGTCSKDRKCAYRHVLTREDLPNHSLPQKGWVKVDITYVYSPVHFRARLLEHRNEIGRWTKIKNHRIELLMTCYYCKNKPRALSSYNVGDLAAVDLNRGETKDYVRVRIIKFVEFVKCEELDGSIKEIPKTALLKCIDSGKEITKPLATLVQLSRELASIPETTFDVFVCNLLPIDEDIAWGDLFTELVKQKIVEVRHNESDIKFVGQVQLVIGNSMWLDPLNCLIFKECLKRNILHSFSISRYLLEEKLAIKNPDHLKKLRDNYNLISLAIESNEVAIGSAEMNEKCTGINSIAFPITKEDCESSDTKSSSGRLSKVAIVEEVDKCLPGSSTLTSCSSLAECPPKILTGRKVFGISRLVNVLKDDEKAVLDNYGVGIVEVANMKNKQKEVETKHSETRTLRESGDDNLIKSGQQEIILSEVETANFLNMSQTSKEPIVTSTENFSNNDMDDGKFLNPSVMWKQDYNNIYLIFRVNSDEYTFTTFNGRHFSFEATVERSNYKLDETLFGCFIHSKVRHYKSGVEIRAVLPKLSKGIKWHRLLRRKTSFRWLTYKIEDMSDSSQSESDFPFSTSTISEFERTNLACSVVSSIPVFEKRPDDIENEMSSSDSETDYNKRCGFVGDVYEELAR